MKRLTTIEKFKEGISIQGFYLCVEKHLRHTRSGDLYIDLVLRDKTGHISAKIWDKVSNLNSLFETGDAVAVSGDVECFMDRLNLIVRKIRKATIQSYGRYGFDPVKIVPSSVFNPNKMWKEIEQVINRISNKYLKKLVSNIYKKNKKKLLVYPASIKRHHNYRSGLLEHILIMVRIGKKIAPLYRVDIDLLLSGILLHNIGKLDEICSGYDAEPTISGNLIGHIILGRDLVRQEIKKIKGFPEYLALKVEHIILAYNGRYDRKSPANPSFKEALLVHLIDNLDANMNLMEIVYNEDREKSNFTNRHNYFRIPLLKDNESE